MEDQEPWDRVPPALAAAARAGVTEAVLPGERPCSITEAIDWVRGMLEEGWYVDYLVDTSEGLVYLRLWEFGDRRPSWKRVRSIARQPLSYTFELSPAARSYCDAIVDAMVRAGEPESNALTLVNLHHGDLPWRNAESIDPMRHDFPEWWAERLLAGERP